MKVLRRAALTLAIVVSLATATALSMTEVPQASASADLGIDVAPYAARGPSTVGVRELDLTPGGQTWIWYPAHNAQPTPNTYPYQITITGALGATTIGRSTGHAVTDAAPDPSRDVRPLVILEPGYGIGPTAYAWLAEHLASHGFVVAASPRDGSLTGAMDGLWRSAVTRPQQLQTLLDTITEWSHGVDPVARQIDPDTVAVVGHSYGGYTALVAGGARLDTGAFAQRCLDARSTDDHGKWLCDVLEPHIADMASLAGLPEVPDGLWPDWSAPTVDAVVSLAGDAYLFGRTGLDALDVPVLAIGGTADTDTPYTWGTQPTYAHAGAPRRASAALDDAGHMVFTARCTTVRRILTIVPFDFCDDTDGLRGQRHQVVAQLTTAFLLTELAGNRTAASALAVDRVDLPTTSYASHGY
jgi:predicted dienelactone hydrolase